jgi:hypothetical protein
MDYPECARLTEEVWSLHAEVVAARDELEFTPKNDPDYAAKKGDLARLEGLQKGCASSLLATPHEPPRLALRSLDKDAAFRKFLSRRDPRLP